MKLLNFSNLEFKWEEEKEIIFYLYLHCVGVDFKFDYRFYYPSSFYFEIYPDITRRKKNYQYWFIGQFKLLKKDITNETA